jgi:hypothetical protein
MRTEAEIRNALDVAEEVMAHVKEALDVAEEVMFHVKEATMLQAAEMGRLQLGPRRGGQ